MAQWQLKVEKSLTLVVPEETGKTKHRRQNSVEQFPSNSDPICAIFDERGEGIPLIPNEFPAPVNSAGGPSSSQDTSPIYEEVAKLNMACVFVNEMINGNNAMEIGTRCKDLIKECQLRCSFLERTSEEDSNFSEYVRMMVRRFRETEKRYRDWCGPKSSMIRI